MQSIVNAETGEDLSLLWAIVNGLLWRGPKIMTHCSWINFVYEVHNPISSDNAVRALWCFQKNNILENL